MAGKKAAKSSIRKKPTGIGNVHQPPEVATTGDGDSPPLVVGKSFHPHESSFLQVAEAETFSPRLFGPQHVFENRARRGLGWLRDMPDIRDMTLERLPAALADNKDAKQAHQRTAKGITAAATSSLAKSVDNRRYCSRIEDQGQLGSCTANACVGMVEYMERRASGRHIEGSRLFVYKTTRKLLGWDGDTGAFLRTTMKALVHFGVPPEEVWPYDISSFDNEPDPFMYAYASNYKAVRYLRLDPPAATPEKILDNVKGAVAKGYAVMFGFVCYSSLDSEADIPFPAMTESVDGGHAVLIVGYDDKRPCRGALTGDAKQGAFLIRNSWGRGWGENGYGWLPYQYVRAGIADDFWTCFKLEWVESGEFD